MTTNFADISHHNGTPDLAKYKAAGHERIVIKATEGTGFTDPMFKANWQAAGKAGLKRVAYHFARAKFNGAAEFDFFYKTVQAAGGFGPKDSACLDVEDPDTPDRAAAEMKEFVNRAVAKGITRGLIYTYNYYGVHHAIAPSQLPVGWRHMWMADYTVGQADSDIELGAGWTRDQVVARQYTDRAIVAGIGSTDYSRLEHEWLTAVDAESVTLTPEQLEEMELADAKQEILDAIHDGVYLLMYGDNADDTKDKGTHPNDLQKIRQLIMQLIAAQAASDAKVSALVAALGTASSGQFDLAAVEAAAEKGAADALARVELTVGPAA
jgi:Lyzozyme M1 (1,4-beta-N-acetylmuramidase)